jgi:hypothetical protein
MADVRGVPPPQLLIVCYGQLTEPYKEREFLGLFVFSVSPWFEILT